ncbi:ABC transporter permease subunit [Parvibaculum sp.]|uniref:ABC transporter permease subunit n=1 Tax=Parvibaculum sp. TaxID=2024848 RepID=UPI0039192311
MSETAPAQSDAKSFLAHRRSKVTSASVLIGDKVANWVITVGGLLVIFAVVGILVFLVRVVMPLAGSGEIADPITYRLDKKDAVWLNADEYSTIGARAAADGKISAFHVPTGRQIPAPDFEFDGKDATAVGGVVRRDQIAFGFEDGTVRFASFGFDISVVIPRNLPSNLVKLDETSRLAADGAVFTQLPRDQYRRVALSASLDEPQQISEFPIVAVDYRVGGTVERPTRSFVTFDTAGVGRLSRAETQRNLLTGTEQVRVSTTTLPALPSGVGVNSVVMTSTADAVYVAATDGNMYRYDTRDFRAPVLAETRRVFGEGDEVTRMAFLTGEQALVVGGSNGAVDVFFRLQQEGARTADGYAMERARVHEPNPAAIVDIAVSPRSKALVTQDADGNVWVRHSTSDQVLARFTRPVSGDIPSIAMMMARVDGALVLADDGSVDYFRFKFPHYETTLQTIFGKVWYEGYSEPTYTWQSSSGTDVFEPKFSLIPLIFGTLKATVYALLFAVPIALMGAIYTSEFVHRRVRATVKPVMEMMESLPTVVLGFVAALILAPIVETWIGAVLLAFIALPLGLMLSAFIWQSLPVNIALRLDGIPKFICMFLVVFLTTYIAYRAGPLFETVLFHGDFKAWVNGDIGTGFPMLFIVLLPLSYVFVSWLFNRLAGHTYRARERGLDRASAGRLDFMRWAALLLVAVVVSFVVSTVLAATGFDLRGGVVDTYVQRNALVVGFVMGFAVIPNIYTLAEDAMNSVPSHLRAASLATGATPWQTAMWVIIPTAMSGIFAAVMIGMGRAVGETMIVVMAAGNTPVLDWNIFNGLRTLSANIAVELPEAVIGGSLYRMLFLAALTLFVMTFVINTLAEIIRQRFRKRAFQL